MGCRFSESISCSTREGAARRGADEVPAESDWSYPQYRGAGCSTPCGLAQRLLVLAIVVKRPGRPLSAAEDQEPAAGSGHGRADLRARLCRAERAEGIAAAACRVSPGEGARPTGSLNLLESCRLRSGGRNEAAATRHTGCFDPAQPMPGASGPVGPAGFSRRVGGRCRRTSGDSRWS